MYKFINVDDEQRKDIASLFEGIEDSMVIGYLQGYQGNGYVDRFPDPTVGLIVSGEYSFFGGDPRSLMAKELVRHLFYLNKGRETVGIFADHRPKWENTLMSVPENYPRAVPRFGIAQKDYDFDMVLMDAFISKLPKGYDIKPFDIDMYEQAMKEEWSKEFCETFESAEEYLNKGFGFGVIKDGKLVSGTSTMTVYDGGTEIQVATHPEYRRKGLAMTCAAAFIKECMRCNIRPCWDAANETSRHMALMLGYEYKGEYTTIHMHASINRPIKMVPYWP